MAKPYEPTPSTAATKALTDLKTLPSLQDTQTQVQGAVNEISSAVTALIPAAHFEDLHGGATDKCEQPYEQTGGKRYFLPDRVAANIAVSEADWDKILQAAKASAAKLGATDIQTMQDQPGNHNVGFYGPAGLFIKVGYQGNLGISGYTGCRLPAE
ncbi:LppA family lipoprotein [Mycolicibacterium sp. Dal123E01]|uniref:LppA family lipoprotein n=1 Tax=Mycolicibacterium sp. Dal123E01 TaxID=3457578 RepID=UPI00403E506F